MCQLSFICFPPTKFREDSETLVVKREEIASLMLTLALFDSEGNKDGYGMYTPNRGLWKTHLSPTLCANVGECIMSDLSTKDKMIMQHVRNASLSSKNLRTISDPLTHPFESEHYILAHNGTLNYTDRKNEDQYKDREVIDSIMFLEELEKAYDPDITVALNKAMSLFEGKFAFIIFERLQKTFYIAKGETADLYISEISKLLPKTNEIIKCGYVVNTQMLSLTASLRAWNSTNYIYTGSLYDYSLPKEVDKNTVFKCTDAGLEKVGVLEERKKLYQAVGAPFRGGTTHYTQGDDWWSKEKERKALEASKATNGETTTATDEASVLARFLLGNELTIYDLDKMLFVLFGSPLLSTNIENIKLFINKIAPAINKRNGERTKEAWRLVCGAIDEDQAYDNFKLQYPYPLNQSSEIIKAYDQYEKEQGYCGM
jgi:predicted glutamine amidotransferase